MSWVNLCTQKKNGFFEEAGLTMLSIVCDKCFINFSLHFHIVCPCNMISLFRNNQTILGLNNSNIPRIIAVIAEAFAEEVFELESEVKTRLTQIIRTIQVHFSIVPTAGISMLFFAK